MDDAQEREAFEAVIDLILARWAADPGMHVYHFGHYEPAALKRLMGRYATRAEALDRLLRGERFVDLHAIVRHALRAGVESYSIKQLEQFYGFTRETSLDDAAAHLRAIEMALEAERRGRFPTRRGELSRATTATTAGRRVRFATGSSASAPSRIAEAPPCRGRRRLPTSRRSASSSSMRTSRRFARSCSAGIPASPLEREPTEQIRWLLAYLIDWHRRESKAEWWEFFRLCELPEEELLDESLAIAGLTFVERSRRSRIAAPADRPDR